MFDRRETKTLMTIHDNRAGQGMDLSFPSMSTCAAIICVMEYRLVGLHKTLGPATDSGGLFKYAKTLIGEDKVHLIAIAGWVAKEEEGWLHNPRGIREQLDQVDTPTYYYNYETGSYTTRNNNRRPLFKPNKYRRRMIDLCTFASHNGTDFPLVSFKRSTKVTVTPANANSQYGSVDEQVRSSHDHLINRSEFKTVG